METLLCLVRLTVFGMAPILMLFNRVLCRLVCMAGQWCVKEDWIGVSSETLPAAEVNHPGQEEMTSSQCHKISDRIVLR